MLVFQDIEVDVKIKNTDGYYKGSISREGVLQHVSPGTTADELRQIAVN